MNIKIHDQFCYNVVWSIFSTTDVFVPSIISLYCERFDQLCFSYDSHSLSCFNRQMSHPCSSNPDRLVC